MYLSMHCAVQRPYVSTLVRRPLERMKPTYNSLDVLVAIDVVDLEQFSSMQSKVQALVQVSQVEVDFGNDEGSQSFEIR